MTRIIQEYLLVVQKKKKLIIEIKRKTFDRCPISALFPEVTPAPGVVRIRLKDFSFCACRDMGADGNVEMLVRF